MSRMLVSGGALAVLVGLGVLIWISRDDGDFELAGPDDRGAVVSHPDAARRAEDAEVGRDGGHEAGSDAAPSLRLARITGRVVGADGAPLPATPVILTYGLAATTGVFSPDAPAAQRTETDATGAFVLVDVEPGFSISVRAQPVGCVDVVRATAVLAPREIALGDLVATAGGGVEGVVRTAAGAPLEGALVAGSPQAVDGLLGLFASSATDPGLARTARTDADGRYRLAGLAAGPNSLVVQAEGHPPAHVAGVEVRIGEVTRGVDVQLEAGRRVAGVVKSEAGKPIAGATLTLRHAAVKIEDFALATRGAGRYEVTTDAEGSFALVGLRREAYKLRVHAPGFLPGRELTVAGDQDDVQIALTPAGLVVVSVWRAGTDQGVGDFEVTLGDAWRGDTGPGATIVRGPAAAVAAGAEPASNVFVVTDLSGTAVQFEVQAPGLAWSSTMVSGLASGERRSLRVDLAPEITVTGRVDGPDGQPLAGATVEVLLRTKTARQIPLLGDFSERNMEAFRRGIGAPGGVRHSARTGADGRYLVHGLGEGAFEVVARKPGLLPSDAAEIELLDGFPVRDLDLALGRGGRLAGFARTADGAPLPGARILLLKQEEEGEHGDEPDDGFGHVHGDAHDHRPFTEIFGEAMRRTVADAEGHYEIDALRPGHYAARLEEPLEPGRSPRLLGRRPQMAGVDGIVVMAGETTSLDLRLIARGTLVGRVATGGVGASDAEVAAQLIGTGSNSLVVGWHRARTDGTGSFRLENLDPGQYRVTARAPGSPSQLQETVTIGAAGVTELVLELPSARITGCVRDAATGRPVAGARVAATRAGENADALAPALEGQALSVQSMLLGQLGAKPVRTDVDGCYRIESVEPGDYALACRHPDYVAPAPQRITVGAKTAGAVDFALGLGGTLHVSARLPAGRAPFLKVEVWPAGAESEATTRSTPGAGPVRFPGLVPGRWVVRATCDDRSAVETVTLVSGGQQTVEIDLREPR